MYVKFDLSSIPTTTTVTKAILACYTFKVAISCCDGVSPMAQHTKTMYKVNAAWAENAINWNKKPAVGSSPITTCTNTTTPAWETFDVTSAVQAMVAKPSTNFGFMFRCPEGVKDYGITMRSSEASAQTYPPKLTLTLENTGLIASAHLQRPEQPYSTGKMYDSRGNIISGQVSRQPRVEGKRAPSGLRLVQTRNGYVKTLVP